MRAKSSKDPAQESVWKFLATQNVAAIHVLNDHYSTNGTLEIGFLNFKIHLPG